MIEINQKAPNFVLKDQEGVTHSLEEGKGKWVLLYFYPKDDTPGCTVEACQMRDSMPNFSQENMIVFGISKDDASSHVKFAKKFNLNFPILSDEDVLVCNLYGVYKEKSMYGKKYMGIERTSFLINPEGFVVKIYEKVKPDGHALEVLSDVKRLK